MRLSQVEGLGMKLITFVNEPPNYNGRLHDDVTG